MRRKRESTRDRRGLAPAHPTVRLRTIAALLAVLAVNLPGACAAAGQPARTTVLSYNVQNLFDGTDDGGEYERFRATAGWDRERYYERLGRVDEVVRIAAGRRVPDVVVLQEVESASVAFDLARDFLRGARWVSAGASGVTTTQVVVLSRARPKAVRAHAATEVELVPDAPPRTTWRGRDVVDVRFADPGLRVLACHWKSQSGGVRETAPYRIREARLVATVVGRRVAAAGEAALVVGDLNESARRSHGAGPPGALAELAGRALTGGRAMRSLWAGSTVPGTYRYRGEWERLDRAYLVAGDEVSAELRPVVAARLLDGDGAPMRYDERRRRGYSDHLPIVVTLTIPRSP